MVVNFVLVLICLKVLSHCLVTKKDQTDFYSKLTKQILNFEIESGYVSQPDVDGTGHTFYHLVYKVGTNHDTTLSTDPLVIWINGGPGCSSQIGFFEEVGPFEIKNGTSNDNFIFEMRKVSWNQRAIQLFADQPFGAGLSYTSSANLVDYTTQSAIYYAEFLVQFYEDHPYLKQNPFYIFGGSFAGHYIPAISSQIIINKKLQDINFQGIGIGDPWTTPFKQISTYAGFLYSAGIVDKLKLDYLLGISAKAQQAMTLGDYQLASQYFGEANGEVIKNAGGVDQYNFQQYVRPDGTTPLYWSFFNLNKAQFDVPAFLDFQDCNQRVFDGFKDTCMSREGDLVVVLQKGIKVLIFNGQLDYIVNTPGVMIWLNQMKWEQIYNWKAKEKKMFKYKDTTVGWYKNYDNFQFVNIYKAGIKNSIHMLQQGHMVPIDQPEVTYQMFLNYLDDTWN